MHVQIYSDIMMHAHYDMPPLHYGLHIACIDGIKPGQNQAWSDQAGKSNSKKTFWMKFFVDFCFIAASQRERD